MIFSEAAELVENHNCNLTKMTQRDRVAVLLAGYGEVESFRELSLYNQAATKYIASQFLPIPQGCDLHLINHCCIRILAFINSGIFNESFARQGFR